MLTDSQTISSQQPKEKQGVLLVNLGTPDAPETGPVRRYLRQFLSDPRVLDISPLGRFLLLNLIILPRRPKESAEAYRSIWTKEGSPILIHGRELTRLTQEELDRESPGRFLVKLGMRYGEPSIERVLAEFAAEGVDRIRVLPLFPQYASATVGSAMEEVYRVANKYWNMPTIEALPPFYDHPGYLESFAVVTRESVKLADYQYYLFSFHGLPERQIKKGESPGENRCLTEANCCSSISARNRNCYRAQCFATARGIAQRLNLEPEQWSVSFQSRLGREPWIQPYTDEVMKELPKKGIKSLVALSPAFVADCLETLEELGIRGEEDFFGAGGEKYKMIPSLNTHPDWVDTVVSLVTDRTGINDHALEGVE